MPVAALSSNQNDQGEGLLNITTGQLQTPWIFYCKLSHKVTVSPQDPGPQEGPNNPDPKMEVRPEVW